MQVGETGWLTAGDGRALWTPSTPEAALFQIAEYRNREQSRRSSGDSRLRSLERL
ncbi:MAG: hypothetical protein ACXVHJ_31685 [Solirubrobacteraceae bacterium]